MAVIQAMVQGCCRQVTKGTIPGESGKGLCWGMDHGSLLQLKEFQVLDGHLDMRDGQVEM